MEILWNDVQIPERQAAEGLYEREVVVIGAGMTGLLTAWQLQKTGKQVAVLEADRIASGQTGRTTAKITSQHGLVYGRLVKNVGAEKARLYARANQEAIREYERMIRLLGINCDFSRLPSYLYSTEDGEALRREAETAAELGLPARFVQPAELPFEIAGAVCFENQAQFHPLKFLRVLAEELEIYERSPVKKVRGNVVYTDKARFRAGKIVFATHYPIRNVPGFYFLRQHQERSYVLGLAGCRPLQGMYYSADRDGLSLRSVGDVLLLGGSACRTGANRQGGAWERLEERGQNYFPKARPVYRWAAQDCMPHDGIPFVGKYFYGCQDWLVATGYGKWGMTSAMAAALLLTDRITGKENPYERLFTPQRHHIRGAAGNLIKDLGESVDGLTKGLLFPRAKRGEGEPKRCARCTHMGCRLNWNPDEESWDCPCHGSRFDRDGRLLDEPAQKSRVKP